MVTWFISVCGMRAEPQKNHFKMVQYFVSTSHFAMTGFTNTCYFRKCIQKTRVFEHLVYKQYKYPF